MVKASDYIARKLVESGVADIFMLSGGGAMHLNDSLGNNENLNYICCHHEQALAIAAEGYARSSGRLAVVNVTTGPGGTNTLTGVMGQWTDSVPVLYISGQVKQETTIESCRELGLRQLGDQEVSIVHIMRSVTKYADIVKSVKEVKYKLEKAIKIATTGRPGPVWLDIPMDIQGALLDESDFIEDPETGGQLEDDSSLSNQIQNVVKLLETAQRPLIVAGHGIRIAKAQEEFYNLVEKLGIPIVTTFNGFDLIHSDHPLYIGRIGTIGDRAGNFALQNSDLVIIVGSRNNIRQVSYNWDSYARAAKKIIVDIDRAELLKPTIKPDLAILADAKDFIVGLLDSVRDMKLPDWHEWLRWAIIRKNKYPTLLEEYKKIKDAVHPYFFINQLTDSLNNDAIVVAGNGTACVVLFQAGIVKKGQRIFWNSGCASMGYDLPAAIGACMANPGKEVICITGEGSLQMNLQELQTVVYHKLPLKLFVINNKGYCSIRQTQTNYFNGKYVACDELTGLSFPDLSRLAPAYGLQYNRIESHEGMSKKIEQTLALSGPVVCDVQLTLDYTFSPKLSSERKPDGKMVSKPLEDMYPFLSREEFYSNMIISPMEE
ncbi:thiamine pyrophosphate-binding protein [Paenibacillus sp. GCM10027626]|uniref:thiamine pyrophosphate-binding protein n=1 Tax=Paenibacillus sp. GCM10027626 TaxID=3273411 RepID=UPI00362E5836